MLHEANTRRARAASGIRAYLHDHPHAADTEHGIAQWWLPQVGVEVPLADVQSALRALVQRGDVQRTVLPDGTAIYRGLAP
ncbi:hypothetical protein HHL11_24050 [Ramlibacter sp. G-1-2-2]|uniref:Uncharacterized protein n=1 Tax=Ramlibacter agri TaxID=2728837 RepID=A0A848HBF7_9BURK|nr:hypothetical protein [Ramlibacter agri]NML46839.1 hypothetical protein [Ramlibacter agri]